MFLFSRKTKTPISTYADSYRAPTSIKEVYKDPPLWAWEANKFVTRGLSQTMQRHVDPEALQKMLKCAVQDYSYKSSLPGHPYLPEKYWLSQPDRCNPNYLCSDQYNAWRTEPYYCNGWDNKYITCLPRLPKEAGMETALGGMPLECPPKPERLNAYERDVVVKVLNSLTRRQQLPQIPPRCGCLDPLQGRLPCRGYVSPCSGRHYCLRGMDYCVSGAPCAERQRALCAQPSVRCLAPCEYRPGMQCAVIPPPPSYYPCPNLRWDTSHFKKTGGPQRNNYVVHPEFVSETYPDYHCY
ncbi:spermatid-specific manchette-related protein 1 isoform X2 [Talpa occidentalis]|uniref:spermatid-specific manchette-related protein 1 isoform X2 n=1 Tax=Talpa occidentalis TaxID=50954 RepID=UPI00188FA4F1|nr:spermatid-specific manchette-related protein 1 isoform X2 [Talpa occidentalis]